MSIKKIAVLADIHLRKSPSRHEEYREVFDRLYKSLKKQNPDRIILVGDLVHDYIDLQPELTILAGQFLNELSKIAPVRIIRGNHDLRKKNLKRTDAVEAIVKTIDNPNVVYYNETDFFEDENIFWAVWKHGEKNNSPWVRHKKHIRSKDHVYIDLFHDPINGCKSPTGFEFKGKYNKLDNFKGEFSFFGDIHKKQLFTDNTKGYPGSLIAQDFGEGDYEFHGYLIWDIENKNVDEITIENDYSFKNVKITPFTDFDNLDIEIDDITKYMRIRVIWMTMPNTRNVENYRKVVDFINDKYSPIQLTHSNQFIEDDDIELETDITIDDIQNQSVQHDIFRKYFEKTGVDEKLIEPILELDDLITSKIEVEDLTNIVWDIERVSGTNFMSYRDIDIDFHNKNGVFQITGLNTAGKTTILKLINYVLYQKTPETESRVLYGDKRFINNRLDVDYCQGEVVLNINGECFGIKRYTKLERKKDGEIKGAPTIIEYYKLSSYDEPLNEDNSLANLDEGNRNKTQNVIEKAIGSYDNFMRVVMTTSDSLNSVLSSDKSDFTDAILRDSGLDIFDIKLSVYKNYKKKISNTVRVSCNVEEENKKIDELKNQIDEIDNTINDLELIKIPDVENKLTKGDEYIEKLTKSIISIDKEITSFDEKENDNLITSFKNDITQRKNAIKRNKESINELVESFDEERLNTLLEKYEVEKGVNRDDKYSIRELGYKIDSENKEIALVNGEILRLKAQGKSYKDNIFKLKNDKNCPTCGQLLDQEHQKHINREIEENKKLMYEVADEIKIINKKIPDHEKNIEQFKSDINFINKKIEGRILSLDKMQKEIGELTNDKNDVLKRKELIGEIESLKVKNENTLLLIEKHETKQKIYEQNLANLEKNKEINSKIEKAKMKYKELFNQRDTYKYDLNYQNNLKAQKLTEIGSKQELIKQFLEQEFLDLVHNTYEKCIHRNGIPTQLLKTYTIPKINKELGNTLKNLSFNVWLDQDDLKPKLVYNNATDAVIDAISSSGKERTFSSVALKFALNRINHKSKPNIFLLDEVMGKLTEDSVEEFIDLLKMIKEHVNKVFIIEHNHEIDPTYIISVTKDDNDISSLTLD